MKTPNFFIIGASKGGTTSLASALGGHRMIFMSPVKEPDFFSRFDETDQIDQQDVDTYLSHFRKAKDEPIVGEASVNYLDSERAAEHIHAFAPDAKVLVSLRNPFKRLISLYEMYVRHGLEQTLEYATISDPWLASQCLYANRLKRFSDVFPREQIFVVHFDDLESKWSETIEDICGFLSIPAEARPKPTVQNRGGLPSHPSLRFLMSRQVVNAAKNVLPNKLHSELDRGVKRLAFTKTELPENCRDAVFDLFSEDTRQLDEVLGTQFHSLWFNSSERRV